MPNNNVINESGTIGLSDVLWAKARYRAEVIGFIAEREIVPITIAVEAAEKLNLSERTIYGLIRRWRESGGSVTSLVSKGSSGGKGGSRLATKVESLISEAIRDSYLSRQKPSIASLMRVIKERCYKANVNAPSFNTVRARIRRLQPEEVLYLREGASAVRKLHPIEGQFPKTNSPLEVIQIDHTSVDLIIVDTYNRQPIGRPWITIAIDVYSRCIVGFYLTLEAPSATSVGLCLVHTVIDKRSWLERIGAEVEWPMSGKPRVIHVDNGSEFHSEALRRGCEVHGIRINYRPVGSPHYGGIVERVIGTMMKMVHDLPGTTFSNIIERGGYQSEKMAILTLAELEKWFALAISAYHSMMHSSIKEPPITKWKSAVNNDLPYFVLNAKAFLVDFLPITRRKIQRQGFVVDHINYMNNSLKPWITSRDNKRTFIIRRDPRDLSKIYVLDPEKNYYVEVPYRAMANPAITIWEHKFAVKKLREEGRRTVNEEEIMRIIQKMRIVTQQAVIASKSARRAVARRQHLKSSTITSIISSRVEGNSTVIALKPIKLFDEIEEW